LTINEEAVASVGNRDELFKRERDGWEGYASPEMLL
jgi:hypothetical protein